MAPGTRTPNARKISDDCAGLPRDLDTNLPGKAVARLRAVFCLPATCQTAAKYQTKEHRSKAFNACINGGFYAAKRRKSRPVEAHRAGTNLMHWLAGGFDEAQSLVTNMTACSAALAPASADAP